MRRCAECRSSFPWCPELLCPFKLRRDRARNVLRDRERDADGHLLPVHPQDPGKGPR